MLEYLCKIGTLIKANFSWNRNHSPSQSATAKSKNGSAVINQGDYSPVQIAEGDIHNYPAASRNSIDYAKAWNDLIAAFSPESCQKWIDQINDPRQQMHLDTNVSGTIKWLSNLFRQASPDATNPCAKSYVELHERAVTAAEEFCHSRDATKFQADWTKLRDELMSIKLFLVDVQHWKINPK